MNIYKYLLITCFILFVQINSNAQNQKGVNIYYGAHYFMPSKGYAHGFGLHKNFFESKLGNINGEISFLVGGPYSFNFYTAPGKVSNLDSPYKILHATIGSNFEIPLTQSKKNKISIGIFGGYSRYEIPITTQIVQGNGGSVQVYLEPRNRLVLGTSLRYKHGFKINNLNFYIIPNYNIYRTSIFTHSASVLISIEL
jgi:hypothetical protein